MPVSITKNMDCLEAMRGMADNAFDLALADIPYGIGASRPIGTYARQATGYSKESNKNWDISIPSDEYFKELFRVSVNQVIFGANYVTEFLPPSMGWVSWYKTDEVKDRSFSEIELIFTSFQRAARHFEFKPFIRNGNRIHPTQKPVALYRYLLTNYAKPGNTILDTHLGSQSSRIAAYDLGFGFTGFELDADYFAAGEERFARHIAQPKLFAPVEVEKTQVKLFG